MTRVVSEYFSVKLIFKLVYNKQHLGKKMFAILAFEFTQNGQLISGKQNAAIHSSSQSSDTDHKKPLQSISLLESCLMDSNSGAA